MTAYEYVAMMHDACCEGAYLGLNVSRGYIVIPDKIEATLL